jgi:hypothetical protein
MRNYPEWIVSFSAAQADRRILGLQVYAGASHDVIIVCPAIREPAKMAVRG